MLCPVLLVPLSKMCFLYIYIDDFNDIILNFEYSGKDKNNKPQIVKKKLLNSLKVKQTACEMWTLLRLLPLIVGRLIPNTV